MDKLKQLRNKIDQIDEQILELLNKRAEVVLEIAKVKTDQKIRFHNPERERQIIDRLLRLNKGPFPNDALKVIFREILSASLSLEEPLKVACLGPLATFTHLAAIRHFGSSAEFIPVKTIKDVFEVVHQRKANYGVVPIENSNEGVISYTLDMFVDSDLKVAGEIMLEINHNLVSKAKSLKKIKRIYSHPQALAQCRNYIEKNLPNVSLIDAPSTAKAAEMASKDPEAAAIASDLAAKIYDLNILERNIEDNRNNYTRFLIIGDSFPGPTGNDKTSIMLSIKDRPGALYDVLAPFKRLKINLTKIESRPSRRRAWEYIFFIDMEGHIEDKKLTKAFEEVEKHCLFLKVLGSYPRADEITRMQKYYD